MSRKRGGVEIAVTAGLLAFAVSGAVSGCAYVEPYTYPTPSVGSGTPIPDGVDYARAVQCGGLLWAIQGAEYRYSAKDYYRSQHNRNLVSETGLYIEWAELLAQQSGADPALARADVAASRDLIIASTGGISPLSKAQEIRETYQGDYRACSSMAENADEGIRVIIGG